MFERRIRDRMEAIEPLVRAGSVLDVGCVDARPAREASARRIEAKPNLLFLRLCELNAEVTGLDIDAEGVAELVARGHRVVCGDAQTADLGRTFDTIVAGEVIEHIENPGQFLRNMRRHLSPGGRLVVSTPNPFDCAQTWRIWRHGRPAVHEGHVAWFDPATLTQPLSRCGFELVEGYWVQPRRPLIKTWKRLFRPYFRHSLLCVARLAP